MIKIRSYQVEPVRDVVPTGKYIINVDSTMGRLVKKMLDKKHIGREVFDSAFHIVELGVDDSKLDLIIYRQIENLERQGRHPRKILMGAVNHRDLGYQLRESHGYWQAQIGYAQVHPCTGERTQKLFVLGLPVTVVPTMDGVLVLDDIMLEIPR